MSKEFPHVRLRLGRLLPTLELNPASNVLTLHKGSDWWAMNDVPQLASAMLVMVFAAVMLVVGQTYIETRSAKLSIFPAAHAKSILWTKHLDKLP